MGYQEEKKILKEEMDKKFSTLVAEENEAMKKGLVRGLDSEYDIRRKKLMQEQNRRLKELKEKYKEDFLKVTNGYEFEEFKKRHKGEHIKFSDFDEEMRIHMNNLIPDKLKVTSCNGSLRQFRT